MTVKKKVTTIKSKDEKTKEIKMQVSASTMSAAASESFATNMFPDMNIGLLINEIETKITSVQSGDMQVMEAMLVGQAQALQTMFACLARKASKQELLKPYGLYMNLALKAQSQSRATIQALTELKYPKQVAFVKQANISNGHQQINNVANMQSSANCNEDLRAEENITSITNELLEVNNGSEKMDGGTANATISKDKAMAALAT